MARRCWRRKRASSPCQPNFQDGHRWIILITFASSQVRMAFLSPYVFSSQEAHELSQRDVASASHRLVADCSRFNSPVKPNARPEFPQLQTRFLVLTIVVRAQCQSVHFCIAGSIGRTATTRTDVQPPLTFAVIRNRPWAVRRDVPAPDIQVATARPRSDWCLIPKGDIPGCRARQLTYGGVCLLTAELQ